MGKTKKIVSAVGLVLLITIGIIFAYHVIGKEEAVEESIKYTVSKRVSHIIVMMT